MSKLLNKPLKAFTLYALVLLILVTPVYFFVVDFIWLSELDEQNDIIRQRIEMRLKEVHLDRSKLDATISIWNTLQPGSTLEFEPSNIRKKDSIYTYRPHYKYATHDEVDRFRVLSSY